MSRHASVSRLLLLTLGLGLTAAARAEEDAELRGQRATRRVLKEQAGQGDPSQEARAQARARNHQAMEMLKPLIQQAEGEQRAAMILRLAELYAGEADLLWREAMAPLDATEPGCGFDGLPACETLPAALESREWRAAALRLYRQVVEGYPQLPGADEAAWGQAMAQLELGLADEALRALTWLVRNRPDSEHAASAYVLIGDHHFDRDRAVPALNAYRHAAAYADAPIRPYALYKLGWCYYNLGSYDEAIAVMRAVALDQGERMGSVALQEEARRDLARFYVDAGDLGAALDFFDDLNRPDLFRQAMQRVVTHAQEQGEHDLAVKVLRLMLARLPQDPSAPAWQAEVARVICAQGRDEQALEALQVLVRDYGTGSAWARVNAIDPAVLEEGRGVVEATLRDLAVDWHQRARKLRRGAEAERVLRCAGAAYQAWLGLFEQRPEAHELRYAYAELLYQQGDHEGAYTQYREVVQRDPGGARSLFCAESAVYVADEHAGRAVVAGGAPPGAAPVELSLWEQRLVGAVDQYRATFPTGERSQAFATKAAWLLYHRNHFAEAADRFAEVIAMDPRSEEAEIAAGSILDSLAQVGDYAKLAQTAEAFLQHEGLGRPGYRAHLEQVHERARFRLIEQALEQGGSVALAAEGFEAFAERFPASEVAPLALHNAAVHYRAVSRPRDAIRVGERLVVRNPGCVHAEDALAGLGLDYESIADFEAAAQWYERLVAEYDDDPRAADALWSAALFRLALGQDDAALRDLLGHAGRWPDHARQAELLATVAGVHEAAGRFPEAASAWERVASLDGSRVDEAGVAQALVRRGADLAAAGRGEEAHRVWRDVEDRWGGRGVSARSPELAEALAEARFRLGGEALERYQAIELAGPGAPSGRAAAEAWARRQVSGKATALQEVERVNAAVLETGAGGWGLAALVRLGGAYEHMADSLRLAWVPPWLTPEQAELYRLALEDEAWRQEEKAAEAYRAAVRRSREIAVYGETISEAGQRLAQLRPDEALAPAEELLAPAYLGATAASSAFDLTGP